MTIALALDTDLFESPDARRIFNEKRWYTVEPVRLAELVQDNFTLRQTDWRELFAYAAKHPDVVPVLAEAPAAIRRVFGNVRPYVEIVEDPEEKWRTLVVTVPTREAPAQALDRLDRLDATWFTDAARRCAFTMIVTVEADV